MHAYETKLFEVFFIMVCINFVYDYYFVNNKYV
jgi:hypothetical protein